jgi:hypothetical protein
VLYSTRIDTCFPFTTPIDHLNHKNTPNFLSIGQIANLVCKLRNRLIFGATLAIEIIVEAESAFTKYPQNYHGYPRFTPVGRITRARVALVRNDYAHLRRWWLN